MTVAADHGLSKVVADTTLDNIPSQRTLIRAGFRLVSADDELTRHSSPMSHQPESISQTSKRRTLATTCRAGSRS